MTKAIAWSQTSPLVFGKIVFQGEVNVAGLNLDEIVFIRHKEVVLYPNEEKKPAFGEGLKRPDCSVNKCDFAQNVHFWVNEGEHLML